MTTKVLVLVLLLVLVNFDDIDAKTKRRKPKNKANVSCKKSDVAKIVKQLDRIEDRDCCTKDDDASLCDNYVEMKNDVTNTWNSVDEMTTNIEEVKTNVEEVKTNFGELQTNVQEVKTNSEEVKTNIEEVKTNVQEVKTNAEEMKANVEEVKTNNEELKTIVEKVRTNNEAMKTDVREVKTNVEEVQTNVEEIKKDISLIKDYLDMLQDSSCKPVNNPIDCSDNPSFTGVRTIQPIGNHTFRVYCHEGCIYMARRFDGDVDFFRGSEEYQQGFGDLRGEHFIGLDNVVNLLSQGNYKLRVEITAWPPVNETRFAEYSIFNVSNKTDNYRLSIGGYRGNAGDSLYNHNGMPFSTKDKDLDQHPRVNCALEHRGAGWYKACHHASLFGYYSKTGSLCPSYGDCVEWYKWPKTIGSPNNHWYSFKKVDMKICPELN